MTPQTLLQQGRALLHQAQVENADCESLWLLESVIGKRWLEENSVSDPSAQNYLHKIHRRIQNEPLAYILESQPFRKREFFVTPAVLIPRLETEILVQGALSWARTQKRSLQILDLGTGSGIIALSLAEELGKSVKVWGCDVSEEALSVAQKNAQRLGLADRVEWLKSDLFDAIPPGIQFDCLCANLPYVPDSDWNSLSKEVQKEPRSALLAGADGLDLIRKAIFQMQSRLNLGAVTFWEVGIHQAQQVEEMLKISDHITTELFYDSLGIARVVKGIHHG